jgi:energy-coupling factor transporter ATP-binding protein EcfA2
MVSNITIPELPGSDTDNPGLIFKLKSAQQQSKDHLWSHHWLSPSGEKLISYGKQDSYHWLRFPALADFSISANLKEIFCYPLAEIPQETIRHLLLDQVLPRCLAHQGKIMLHASGVQLEQGLLLFIGESGAGKSTLAGNFHQVGNPAISDDCLWVKETEGEIVAIPSYGGLRLWEDSLEVLFANEQDIDSMAHYSTKKRLTLSENHTVGSSNGMPVLAVIVLPAPVQSSPTEVILDRLSHREAFIALMKQSFHLNVMDPKRIERHVQALGRIAPRLASFRLSMPHDYELLPLVRQKIVEKVI